MGIMFQQLRLSGDIVVDAEIVSTHGNPNRGLEACHHESLPDGWSG